VLHLLPALELGGVERHVSDLSRAQARLGLKVAVASTGGRLAEQLPEWGVEHIPLPIASKNPLRFLLSQPQIARLLRSGRFQIVHAHSRVPAWHAFLAARPTSPFHLVTTCHSPYRPGLLSSVMARGERVICVSGAVRRHVLRHFHPPEERVRLIYNGIDLERFHPPSAGQREEARRKLGLSPDHLALGNAGRISHAKGWDILLRALAPLMRENPRLRLVIIGDGQALSSLELTSERLGIRQSCHFAGLIQRVWEVLGALDIFVSASRWEGFGYALVEAMAVGLPVVASRVGSVPEYVVDGENGLLYQPGSEEELCEKVRILAESETLRSELGRRAREVVEERFDLRRSAARVVEVYRELVPAG